MKKIIVSVIEATRMELSKADEELIGDFREWLDSCSPDDFNPPDCGVGARNFAPVPQLPPLEAEVGMVALLGDGEAAGPYASETRNPELCFA